MHMEGGRLKGGRLIEVLLYISSIQNVRFTGIESLVTIDSCDTGHATLKTSTRDSRKFACIRAGLFGIHLFCLLCLA